MRAVSIFRSSHKNDRIDVAYFLDGRVQGANRGCEYSFNVLSVRVEDWWKVQV
jgi:hypothetical protein